MLPITELTTTKLFLVFLSVIASSMAMAGDPSLPGQHSLSQVQVGRLLMAELRCAACHTGIPQESRFDKSAPDLSQVGARVSPDFLRSFLASPSTAHPGTTMPDMLDSKSETERQAIAESLTHFLIAQSRSADPEVTTQPIDRQQGFELFHSIGCVACHGPREIAPGSSDSGWDEEDERDDEDLDPLKAARRLIEPSVVGLSHVSAKYTVHSLSKFLFQPLKVRSSGRMPDMKLTPAETLAIAGYLVGEPRTSSEALVPNAKLIEAGKEHFRTLNCAACHTLPGFAAAPSASSLKTANLTQGCLSNLAESRAGSKASRRSPNFQLGADQAVAIAASIRAEQIVETDKDQLAMSLSAFRCIHCHVRDDYGGVHDAHNSYFKGSQLNLGDDGRIPPPLTLMGAKLQSTWMKKVLFDGEIVRQYMATRMPQYGETNLQHLPDLFRRLDVLDGPNMTIPSPEGRTEEERDKEKQIRAAGRELLGDKGANCVACHTFNGKAASVNQGIELLTSSERLQPSWFRRYLQNPGAFRPRTVMPTAWPDGVAAFTTVLDGDTDRQIEAIWYYLSLGTSAADPSGVRAVNTRLDVGDTAVLHRGRSRVAGFRGIAVGLPERLSYAFNAETGTLSAIWEGEFVNVNWSGQGSGDFAPASQSIQLAQDVSFASLEDENAPWPLLPVMTKEAPTNPNPLYPKNVGYQFLGYFLDESFVPTFQYRCRELEIQDRTVAIGDEGDRRLQRVLQFESAKPHTLWFRALVGDIRQESDHFFCLDRLRVTVPPSEIRLRSLPNESKQLELLLRLQIPQGKSTLELQYEPLRR